MRQHPAPLGLLAAAFALCAGVALGVRAVGWWRSGGAGPTCAAGRFVLHGELARDTREWRTWTRKAAPEALEWRAADAHCDRLGLRLPTAEELAVVMRTGDDVYARPLDACAFPDVKFLGHFRDGATAARPFWTETYQPTMFGMFGSLESRLAIRAGRVEGMGIDQRAEVICVRRWP